jgi:hypothetical protein
MLPLQSLVGSGLLALVVTFFVVSVFYAVTLHLAAVFFVGDVASQRAAYVSPVPTITSLLLQQWGPAVVVPVTILGDLVAISYVYRLRLSSAAVLTALHFAFATILGLALNNIFGFV